jgi:hypothetical protein
MIFLIDTLINFQKMQNIPFNKMRPYTYLFELIVFVVFAYIEDLDKAIIQADSQQLSALFPTKTNCLCFETLGPQLLEFELPRLDVEFQVCH